MSFQETLDQLKDFDVNNIHFDKAGVWPWPAKLFVCLILICLIFAGTYYFKISDLNIQLETVVAQEATLKTTYEKRSFEAANLDAYKAQMEEMKVTFDSLLSRLPAKTEVPGLLEDVGTRAGESGLTNININFRPDVVAEYYIEVPIDISVDGGYHDMGGFVSGVAGMPRIVTLHDFSISSSKTNKTLSMKIVAKTYRYKAQEGDK